MLPPSNERPLQDLPEGLGLAELRRSLAQLPKYFTGAFLPQAEALMELLGQPAEATAALKALAGIAKRGQAMDFPATLEDVEGRSRVQKLNGDRSLVLKADGRQVLLAAFSHRGS